MKIKLCVNQESFIREKFKMVDQVEFIYGGKHNESFYYLYDINGDETKVANNIVAKEVVSDDNTKHYIRVEGLKPIHHETKMNKSLINPTFIKVTRDIFENYVKYLTTKHEGLYKLTTQAMQASGQI